MTDMYDKRANNNFFLLLTFSFFSGFIDVSSFIIFDVFSGFPLGNIIFGAIYVSKSNWMMLTYCIFSIFIFISYQYFLFYLSRTKKNKIEKTMPYLLTTLCLISVFIYFSTKGLIFNFLLILLFSTASGLLSYCSINKDNKKSIFITNITTSCIGNILKSGSKTKNINISILILFVFSLGGILGGLVSINFNIIGVLTILLIMFPILHAINKI